MYEISVYAVKIFLVIHCVVIQKKLWSTARFERIENKKRSSLSGFLGLSCW